MRKMARTATVLALLMAGALSAQADFGFGNPEEPALRPYKGLWRGVKAFTYNVVKSLDVGNRKFPGLGVVELGRGVRYGTVELVSSTYKGMMGSRPKPVKAYSRPNEIIDSDPLLRNAADLAGGAIFWGHGGSFEANAPAAVGVFTAQKVVDNSPVLSERERALYLEEKPQYSAQREYLGRRAIERRDDGDVNFLRQARRQRVIVAPVLPGGVQAPALPPPPAFEMPRVAPPAAAPGGVALPSAPPAPPAVQVTPMYEEVPELESLPDVPVPMLEDE